MHSALSINGAIIQLIWCYVIPHYPQTATMNWSTMSSIFLFVITAMDIVRLPTWHSGIESACQCRRCKRHGFDTGLIPGLGRCPRVGNGNPLQYSCMENSMDRGAWSRERSDMTERVCTHMRTHTRMHILVPLLPSPTKIFMSSIWCVLGNSLVSIWS